MGLETNLTSPAKPQRSRSLPPALAWVLVAPLACIGGQGYTTTSASSTTTSGSSETDGMTSTSGKTTGTATQGTTTQGSATQGTATQGTATQGTATQGTATQSTDTDPPCNFVGCDMDIPPHEYCDYHDELCPEGTKCSFDGTFSESACFDLVPTPDMLGEPCEPSDNFPGGMDSCGYELLCWEESCVPFCGGEDFYCPSGYRCTWCQECALGICIPSCDPLIQDCQEGDTCAPNDGDFTCVLDASGDMGAYGDTCEFLNSCDPGLTCVDAAYVPKCEAANCCSPFCDLDSPKCPDDNLECIPWYEEGQAPPGNEVVGLCGLPQP